MYRLGRVYLYLITIITTIPHLNYAGWMRNYGGEGDDYGVYVEEFQGGGYFVVGSSYSIETKKDIWLIKTDAQGDTLWTRTYGGLQDDWATSGQITSDGGFVVTAVTCSFGKGDYDIWLLRLNKYGDTLWTRTFGDSAYEAPNFVTQTSDEGFVIAGYREGEYIEEYDYVQPGDIWLIKATATGDLTWNKRYGRESESDEAYCMRQTSDGGYIVGCHAFLDPARLRYVKFMRTNENGDSLWCYRTKDNWWFYDVEEISDGSYVVCGNFDLKAGIAKISNQGDLLWEQHWGTENNNWATSVSATQDGGYIITGLYDAIFYSTGSVNGDLWLIKTDSSGDTLWTKRYGNNPPYDYGSWVSPTSDGGYISTGITKSYTNGGFDLWLLKTDSEGNLTVDEKPVTEKVPDFEIVSPIGSEIVLRYWDHPEGFRASIFDASGRKVDEIHTTGESGTITWGDGFQTGVYFIKSEHKNNGSEHKVVLVK